MTDALGNRRVDEDLDSITAGSPSRFQIKLYFNVRKDSEEELVGLCDKALAMGNYLVGKVNSRAGGKEE